eukprot:COSAG06_NODE_3404_length_5394_cov_6.648914_9_plen_69_part_00
MFVFLSQPCPAGKDPAPAFAMPPVLWYGTSIQQGGVASRAGTVSETGLFEPSRYIKTDHFAKTGSGQT